MKTKMTYEKALKLADDFRTVLATGCERIEIAGSLRRAKEEVGDIELVAIPKVEPVTGLFGEAVAQRSILDEIISTHYVLQKGDQKYKQINLGEIVCDLYIATPETWGVIYLIRTGCAEFAKWMVTERQKDGALPSFLKVHEGRIWSKSHPGYALPSPEEEDVFTIYGLQWIPPEERVCGFWGELGKFLKRNK